MLFHKTQVRVDRTLFCPPFFFFFLDVAPAPFFFILFFLASIFFHIVAKCRLYEKKKSMLKKNGGGSTSKKKRKKGGQHKVPSTRTCVIKHKIFLDPYKFVSDLLQIGVFFQGTQYRGLLQQ